MSTEPQLAEQRVILRSVSWATYQALLEESDAAGPRLTYDHGVLEIMSPGIPHEATKKLLGRMIEMFTFQHGIEIRSSASTAFKRSELQRGFEADESYYIAHAADIQGIERIDLAIHPPPDLIVEIDLTSSSIPKQDLFASLRVPEVWRFDGHKLQLNGLIGEGYVLLETSRVLPGFPVRLAGTILDRRTEESETKLIQEFVNRL